MARHRVGAEAAGRRSPRCGPADADIEQLIADVGLRPVRVGDIDAIDVVDGAARLWLTLVFREGFPRRLAFRMLTE